MSTKPALNVTDGGEAVHSVETSFTAAEKIKKILYSLVNKYIEYCTLYNKGYPAASWSAKKTGELVLREYTVTTPIRTRSGIIGPQLEKTGVNAGKTYPGGAHQYEFIDYLGGGQLEKICR
jgi:hypothetical protein